MNTIAKRLLAVTLSVALLIGCAVSGLVLPTAAEPTDGNLFPDGNLDGTLLGSWVGGSSTINETEGFGGSKAFEIFGKAGVKIPEIALTKTLKANTPYIFSFKIKGGTGPIGQIYNSADTKLKFDFNEMYLESSTDGWNEIFFVFYPLEDLTTLPGLYLYNTRTDEASVYYDDFGVYEYTPGMNLVPGSDGGALPLAGNEQIKSLANSLFREAGFGTLSLAKDGDNDVWKFSGLSTDGSGGYLKDGYMKPFIGEAGKILKLSFRFKGVGAPASIITDHNTVPFSSKVTSEADANGWKTFTGKLTVNSWSGNYNYILKFAGATEVMVDDFSIIELVPSVNIIESTATVKEGETVTLSYDVVPLKDTVTWTSSDNAIATVSNGVVTGVKAGTATITATSVSGYTDTCLVTVTALPSVEITESVVEVEIGKTVKLTSTVIPEGTAVSWKSGDDSIATVVDGVVTGLKIGTVTITATAKNGKSDTCQVSVVAPPPVYNGLFPNGDMEGELVGTTWEATNATVNATAGFGGGKAWEIKSGSKTLSGVTLKEPLQTGKWYMLRFKQSGGKGLLYFSDGKYTQLVAGEVTTVSNGTAWNEVMALFQVTAQSADLPTFYVYNQNTDGTSVYYDDFAVYEVAAGVNLIPGGDGALPITGNGTTGSLLADFSNVTVVDGAWQFGGLDAAGTSKRLSFGYLNKMLAVNDELTISFRYKGENATASVTEVNGNNGTVSNAVTTEAGADGWKTYTANIKINNSDSYDWGYYLTFSGATEVMVDDFSIIELVPSVNIIESTATVKEGETVTLSYDVVPLKDTVTWTSSDNAIATVSNGVVTGVKAGTATITATSASGYTDTCSVTVTALPSVEITESVVEVEIGKTVKLTSTVIPEGTAVSWKSGDDSIATVVDGVVTGVKAGTVTITATAQGGKSDTCEVTVIKPLPVYNGLFPGGSFEGTIVGSSWEVADKCGVVENTGFNGSKAWELKAGKNQYITGVTMKEALQPNTWYILRGKVTGGSAHIWMVENFLNCSSNEITTQNLANGWFEFQVVFQVNNTYTELPKIRFQNNNAADGSSIYFDDISVYEYEKGTNLVPGNDGTAIPSNVNSVAGYHMLQVFSNNLSLATENGNNVWKFSNLDALPASPYLYFGSCNNLFAVGDTVAVSFRYKGTNAKVTVSLSSAANAKDLVEETKQKGDWTFYTAQATLKAVDLGYVFSLNISGDSEVLIDDFYFGETTEEPIVDFSMEMTGFGVHFVEGAEASIDNADGIRFGTKLNFGTGYKLNADGKLQLAYNGKYYDVVNLGMLLKRAANETALEVANVGGTGASTVWKSVAYSQETNKLKCVEQGDNYIVFVVNMMTSNPNTTFNEREYDARGYIQLDVDGNIETIYTDVMTDSVKAAYDREAAKA